jgi:hypothetical protein
MRKVTLASGMAVACLSGIATTAVAAEVVHLDGPASLAELRSSNPLHSSRARKIMDAAKELCSPTSGKVEHTGFDARNVSCSQSLLRTSNPAKRELTFRLDDTQYIALVTITEDPPKLVASSLRR